MRDFLLLRATLLLLLASAAWFLQPFGLQRPLAALVGVALCGLILFFESRIREITLKRIMGAAALALAYVACGRLEKCVDMGRNTDGEGTGLRNF